MADILDNGGNAQEAQQVNDALIYGTAERLQQLGKLAWELLKRVISGDGKPSATWS